LETSRPACERRLFTQPAVLIGDADRHSDDAPHDVFVEPAASDCAKMNGKDVWQVNGVV